MESAIKWYYKKIHSYDLNNWEKAVQSSEKRIDCLTQQGDFEGGEINSGDYVDVDLVRGSTFSKCKPEQNTFHVLIDGIVRITLYPLFISWWTAKTNSLISGGFAVMYALLAWSLHTYATNYTNEEFGRVSFEEVCLPCLLVLATGSIHCQIASTESSSRYNDEWEMSSEASSSKEEEQPEFVSLLDQNLDTYSSTNNLPSVALRDDMIKVKVWTCRRKKMCRKVKMSFIDVGSMIIRKAHANNSTNVTGKALVFSFSVFVPFMLRALNRSEETDPADPKEILNVLLGGSCPQVKWVVAVLTLTRAVFTSVLFVVLSAAGLTFDRRLRHAKYFSCLTSQRRSMTSQLPHFRLNKIKNLKAWLSLRSYLRRRGPQRSTDLIFTAAYTCFMFLLCFVSVTMVSGGGHFSRTTFFWECGAWLAALATFLTAYLVTGIKIHKKYNNTSILLTEQFNLFMQMERKPEKKEALQRVNNALTTTNRLINETSNGIFGLTKNTIFYSLSKVVVLSALSGAVSEILGFKVKMWKLKD